MPLSLTMDTNAMGCALFAEFPSNPLLRSANISVFCALADKYDFLLVIDESIGNLIDVDVDVLQYADIIVSSLSKISSGGANAMGGSLILNPQGCHYATLKAYMSATNYEDTWFDEDAVFMEHNSHNFTRNIPAIPRHQRGLLPQIHHYLSCKLPEGGYGGLFSLTFTSLAASQAFFDNMPFQKGPSLGTNFTLACPYTILAHYLELGWAAEYGVEEGLVRISVGMEEREGLLEGFKFALRAAEAVV
ncbi:pyridoxal phosphate-dependent transferase [Suillus subluteus]|nr:pyridoxal phosphate-dependent transferase [Suillus subluteus]